MWSEANIQLRPLLIEELYLTALSRPPTSEELQVALAYLAKPPVAGQDPVQQKRVAYEDLVWAIINTKEFLFNH